MSTKQEQFIQDLVQFYRNRGVNNAHSKQFIARLNGKVVNLCELYTYVLEYGGSYKVNQSNLWDEIYVKLFRTNYLGANFAVALRQIYNRYLLQYEKTCSGNFTTEQWNEDEDDENLFSNNNYSNSIHGMSNLLQDLNNVIDSSGQVHNDTKLYCSLLSGLPNELNFAFNVATILSNCNRFDWTNDYKFINVLLESMKSYCCICDQYEEDISFGRNIDNNEDEIMHFKRFIYSSINSQGISKTNSANINGKISENGSLCEDISLPSCPEKKEIKYIERKCNCYRQFCYRICMDEEMLNFIFENDPDSVDFDSPYIFKDIPTHLLKKIEHRLELIAGIILNISVTYDQNSINNVSMIPLLKFLVLLLRSDNINYLNISLDILSNISPSLSYSSSRPHKVYYYLLDILLRNIIQLAMTSNNLHNVTKSFEILARYISCMNNEANHFLETHFTNLKLYERITQLLTCQYDIALLLALLEFCLTLSEARPYLLVQNDNKILIKILMNLLNCDAPHHFTTSAFKKVKVIDERPKQEISHSVVSNMIPHPNMPMINQVVKTSNPTIINSIAVSNVTQNVLDNESFAINWLRTIYEDAPGCSFKVNDIYAEYVKYCCRNSRKNVIAAQSFSFLIKRCFPSCLLNATQTIVEGLSVKGSLVVNSSDIQSRQSNASSQIITQHPQMMSPILKAHLSTPPKNNALPAPSSPLTPNEINQTSTTNTSTLIKSLLANKLRNNQIGSPNPPVIATNSNKPIVTQVSQSLVNSTSTVVISGENHNLNNDMNVQKNVVFTTNPATTYTITPTQTLANNIIVPNTSVQQPHHIQAPQQILLVRTILTTSAQGQHSNPVRLILPASMITQQRIQNPTVNGLVAANNNIVQAIPTQAPLIQTQLSVPSQNIANTVVVNNTQSIINSSQTVASARSTIANSSPLLNVLLDKGKLPDFPSQNTSLPPSSVSLSNNINNSTTSIAPVMQQNQTKMFILTTAPAKQTSNSTTSSESVPTSTNTSGNVTLITNTNTDGKSSSTPLLITTPIVNGDLKPIVSNNSLIKHALENSSPEVNKRLKASQTYLNSEDTSENNIVNPPVVNNINSLENKLLNSNSNSAVNDSLTSNHNDSTVNNSHTNSNSNDSPKQVKSSLCLNTPVSNSSSTTNTSSKTELDYECQWNDCQMKFGRPSEVFCHVHSSHIMSTNFPNIMNCLWGGPEGKGPGCLAKRPKLSLLTHLQDFHCNPSVLKQELARKKQLDQLGSTNILLPQPPAHPGYAQNAAMLAIRRHATNYVETSITPITPLNPLTVSIRLTSALILRNLAERSHLIKKSLELFEPQLCEISISEGRDESRTIAQCLAIMNDRK